MLLLSCMQCVGDKQYKYLHKWRNFRYARKKLVVKVRLRLDSHSSFLNVATLWTRERKKTSKTRWESNLSTSHMIHVFRCQQSKTSSSSRAAALFGHANENWNQISSHTSVRPRLNVFFFQWWFALKNVLDIICEQARITYVFYFSLSVHAHLNWFFFLGVCHLHYFPILGMCIVHLPRGAIYPLNHKLCGNFRNLFFFFSILENPFTFLATFPS